MRNPTSFFKTEYEDLKNNKTDWVHRKLQGPSDVLCTVDGKEMLMLCSNNYLGLANHPRLKKAAISSVERYGAGSGSVRAIAGNMDLHEELEK
jgi:glycine C-acetyltransferase